MDTQPVEYWNSQAKNYDEKIFSTIDEDVTGIITQMLDKYGCLEDGALGCCIDLGCGAGKYLPALAKRFRSVTACDLSPKLADLAKQEVRRHGFENCVVHVRDLSEYWSLDNEPQRTGSKESAAAGTRGRRSSKDSISRRSEETRPLSGIGFESFGFAVMANVLIAPVNEYVRMTMLKNAERCLAPGGRLLVVVPSLESAMYVNMRCEEVRYEGPYTQGKAITRRTGHFSGSDIFQGILERVGVRTKHFLEPEFTLLATRAGFEVEACEKVSYQWRSELGLDRDDEVPLRLRTPPLPWDWLFVLQRPSEPAPTAS